MGSYEQLSMFTMSMEPTTAICCFGRGLASALPVETWMSDLVPNGEYVINIAGHPLVLRPAGITQKAIPKGHEYYHYLIGSKLYTGIFVGSDARKKGGDLDG